MFNNLQFRECIIRPALELHRMWSAEAEELLILTLAQESKGGEYLKQMEGPALGIYQMEPATHDDLWRRFVRNKPELMKQISFRFQKSIGIIKAERMIHDLHYATIMARLKYLSCPMYTRDESLPPADNIQAIAEYYKKFYNTELGAAKVADAITAYCKFTGKQLPKADKKDAA